MSVVRYPDKPTSGRYVYQNRNINGDVLNWAWQCDLHGPDWDEHGDDWDNLHTYGYANTMLEAFEKATRHATTNCGRSNDD